MRWALVLSVLFLFTVAAVIWRSWVDSEQAPAAYDNPQEAGKPQVAYRFRTVEVTETDTDGSRWTIEAREASIDATGALGELSEVKGNFQGESGDISVTAGAGRMTPGPSVELHDGVEIRWESFVATTPAARYLHGQGRVVSDDEVQLVSEGLRVRGRNLEVDVSQQTARIGDDVHAVIGGAAR